MEKIAVRIFLSGKVQGVFFRDNAKRKADFLGVVGWIRNLEDGRVEALVEGSEDKVEEMIRWAKRGPEEAEVDQININKENCRNELEDFKIIS